MNEAKFNKKIELLFGLQYCASRHRNTNFDTIVVFDNDFIDDVMIKRWNSFIKKKKAMINISLEDTINVINNLLKPIVEVIKSNQVFSKLWNHGSLKWK